MINSTTFNFLKHQGLYTPGKPLSPIKHIQRTDPVGIPCVATGNASKILSCATFLRHHPTVETCPGSIGRRHEQKTNTVLFCFGLCPVEHLPICPWCHSFSKRFISVFFLPLFETN